MLHIWQVHFQSIQTLFTQFELLVPALEQKVIAVTEFQPRISQTLFSTGPFFLNRFKHAHDEILALGGQVEE